VSELRDSQCCWLLPSAENGGQRFGWRLSTDNTPYLKKNQQDPEKINKDLLFLDIVTGDDDTNVGEDVTKFEDQLKQANVQHVYTLLAGTHSMLVWRPALYRFLQQIFKR
jgi:enterochelin esterase-like enzyme